MALWGYARVSTTDQDPGLQLDALDYRKLIAEQHHAEFLAQQEG